MMSSIFENSGK